MDSQAHPRVNYSDRPQRFLRQRGGRARAADQHRIRLGAHDLQHLAGVTEVSVREKRSLATSWIFFSSSAFENSRAQPSP